MKYERLTNGETAKSMRDNGNTSNPYYVRLAELEDKIENSTLVELPCKVGDTVYYTLKDEDLFVGEVVGILIEPKATWISTKYEGGLNMWHTVRDIGKEIFLTKAEAEKRFKELRGEV